MNMFINQINQRRFFDDIRIYSNFYQNRFSGNIENKNRCKLFPNQTNSISKKRNRFDRPKNRLKKFDKNKKIYAVDENQKNTLKYYHKNENEKINYYDPTFIKKISFL